MSPLFRIFLAGTCLAIPMACDNAAPGRGKADREGAAEHALRDLAAGAVDATPDGERAAREVVHQDAERAMHEDRRQPVQFR